MRAKFLWESSKKRQYSNVSLNAVLPSAVWLYAVENKYIWVGYLAEPWKAWVCADKRGRLLAEPYPSTVYLLSKSVCSLRVEGSISFGVHVTLFFP
jgi:hypothetical protein